MTDTLRFIKAHATENDFVVLIDVDDEHDVTPGQVASLCDRRAGVGGDGLLRVVRRDGTWFMDYRNADGSVAEMCGNGIRAFAHVLAAEGLEDAREFDVDTRAGEVSAVELAEATLRAAREVDAGRAATPAPTTRTFAGGTLPAAVTWPVKKRPKLLAASITAR